VAGLKKTEGRALLIQGSSTLYPPLLSAKLIDRLMLMTFPILLGEGKSIFDGSEKAGTMKLVDHFVTNAGVVMTTYEPAGEVQTGSFETKSPSEAEMERRAKMEAGSW
jgi:dihydrofolate reductase